MGSARRAAIADLLTKSALYAIEDVVYAFLADELPLAALAPDRVILIDSLSKRIAPGLTLGMAACPPSLSGRIAAAVRSGAWGAAGFPLMMGLQWMSDGIAQRLGAAKRNDAVMRQQTARKVLQGLDVRADPRAYHLWLELPEHWRGESFSAAAARREIAVTPGSAFATSPGHAPNAVRLALASPPPDVLAAALQTLRTLADEESSLEVE